MRDRNGVGGVSLPRLPQLSAGDVCDCHTQLHRVVAVARCEISAPDSSCLAYRAAHSPSDERALERRTRADMGRLPTLGRPPAFAIYAFQFSFFNLQCIEK